MELGNKKIFTDGAHQLGINLPPKAQYLFGHYLSNLKFFNKKINLTAITEDKDIITKHFLDSISVIKCGKIKPGISLLDVGAGAGFPGIPLKIIEPRINLSLLEANQKKALFLEAITKKLNLFGVSIISERAEIFGQGTGRDKFDVVVARALGSLATTFELAVPLLNIGGYFIAQKAKINDSELSQAKEATKYLNCEIEDIIAVKVPFMEGQRSLVVVRKKGNTSPKYPRRPGIPAKKPLGK
ncbi:MAG: 16S rRNA (guanine(527)-N(7))-methyltransferase RsmG [Actinobacteria bacterium]|nr:MAG: 16S rRNA (guanine(527)-N(7))-methyltransferase RsmG [Actinomycetota bacterium]